MEKQIKIEEMRMNEEEIIQNFLTFFFAGSDTSAHGALLCLYFLSEYPEFQEKVRLEVRN